MNKELYDKIEKIVYPVIHSRGEGSYPFYSESFTEVALLIDPYFLFRQAMKEGKTVQVKVSDSYGWVKTTTPVFLNPPEKYRVAEEPKVGEYYRYSGSENIYILTADKKLINIKTGYLWSARQDDAFGGDVNLFEKVDLEINLKNK